jgi:hypothetical protein
MSVHLTGVTPAANYSEALAHLDDAAQVALDQTPALAYDLARRRGQILLQQQRAQPTTAAQKSPAARTAFVEAHNIAVVIHDQAAAADAALLAGDAAAAAGDDATALVWFEQAHDQLHAVHNQSGSLVHPAVAAATARLAGTLGRLGRATESLAVWRAAVTLFEQLVRVGRDADAGETNQMCAAGPGAGPCACARVAGTRAVRGRRGPAGSRAAAAAAGAGALRCRARHDGARARGRR